MKTVLIWLAFLLVFSGPAAAGEIFEYRKEESSMATAEADNLEEYSHSQNQLNEIYQMERRRLTMEAISTAFGSAPWFPFFTAGRQILCETGGDLSSARREKISEILYDRTGREPESHRYRGKGEFAPNSFIEKIISPAENLMLKVDRCLRGEDKELNLQEKDLFSRAEFSFSDPSYKLTVEVRYSEQGDKISFSTAVQKIRPFTERNGEPLFSPLYPSALISAVFEPEACFLAEANIFEYNGAGRLQKRLWLNKYGRQKREIFANKEVLPLEEIYGAGDNSSGKSPEEALSTAERNDRVLVTVIDSGVDYNHPALAYKIPRPDKEQAVTLETLTRQKAGLLSKFRESNPFLRWRRKEVYSLLFAGLNRQIKETAIGWDFGEEDGEPYDYVDNICVTSTGFFHHGTGVAETASRGSDDIAILPLRYPIKRKEEWYSAVQYANSRGSKIINISLGDEDGDYYKHLGRAIKDHPDILFVVAAGNEGRDIDGTPAYPASFDHSNMIVVAAFDGIISRDLWSESNYGAVSVDVAAPGVWMPIAEPQNTVSLASGTSLAAPYVSRISAKIKFLRPELSPEQIKDIIRRTVTPLPELRDKVRWGGVVNEELAVDLATIYSADH